MSGTRTFAHRMVHMYRCDAPITCTSAHPQTGTTTALLVAHYVLPTLNSSIVGHFDTRSRTTAPLPDPKLISVHNTIKACADASTGHVQNIVPAVKRVSRVATRQPRRVCDEGHHVRNNIHGLQGTHTKRRSRHKQHQELSS